MKTINFPLSLRVASRDVLVSQKHAYCRCKLCILTDLGPQGAQPLAD